MKLEVFEIKDYLEQIDAPQGYYNIFQDWVINEAITSDEIRDILSKENADEILSRYQLRGANHA